MPNSDISRAIRTRNCQRIGAATCDTRAVWLPWLPAVIRLTPIRQLGRPPFTRNGRVRSIAIDGGLFVRQRLSSEPDRYRGRRRVPTPPRSRYAVVTTAAFIRAGVVAIGAASNLPDQKAGSPDVLQGLESAHVASDALNARDNSSAACRAENRGAVSKTKGSAEEAANGVWLLPHNGYVFTSPYGIRWGQLHAGVAPAAHEGMPYTAVLAAQVTQAGYSGGC